MAGPFGWIRSVFRALVGAPAEPAAPVRHRSSPLAEAFERPQTPPASQAPRATPSTGAPVIRERRAAARESLEGLRVLVIDDSATVLAILKKMLAQNGCEVFEALDAESGLEQAFSSPPDLILLDIVLPGMSGFVALRLLRKNPQTKDVPVIMISGNKQATEEYYVQRIGADDFMTKPFTRAELFERVQRVFAARRAATTD